MKITFPYMGSTVIYYKLFELLGHEVIMPPRPTQKTVDLGVKYAPEFACFPLKVILGSYLEAIEKGADTIVTSGGHGPCRAGYYGEVHKKILENMGYNQEFIIFDEPKRGYKNFLNNIKKVKGDKSWFEVFKIIRKIFKLAESIDRVEKVLEKRRAYAEQIEEFNKAWQIITGDYKKIETFEDIKIVEKDAIDMLKNLPVHMPAEKNRVKIGIVGEIYVVMEAAVNNNIEEVLNSYGVEVERSHYISQWVSETLIPYGNKESEEILEKGEEYIDIIIGGHAKQSVGHIIDFKEKGFDGIIHLKPFGCLPEIVVQSMLNKISEEVEIPILSLSIDEQMAQANVLTRIEAFLDLIRKKQKKAV